MDAFDDFALAGWTHARMHAWHACTSAAALAHLELVFIKHQQHAAVDAVVHELLAVLPKADPLDPVAHVAHVPCAWVYDRRAAAVTWLAVVAAAAGRHAAPAARRRGRRRGLAERVHAAFPGVLGVVRGRAARNSLADPPPPLLPPERPLTGRICADALSTSPLAERDAPPPRRDAVRLTASSLGEKRALSLSSPSSFWMKPSSSSYDLDNDDVTAAVSVERLRCAPTRTLAEACDAA
eukprot:360950-Chlamydomonas_euryale.AAC.2